MHIETRSQIVYHADSISITATLTGVDHVYVTFSEDKTFPENKEFAEKKAAQMEQALRDEYLASVDMRGEVNQLREMLAKVAIENGRLMERNDHLNKENHIMHKQLNKGRD